MFCTGLSGRLGFEALTSPVEINTFFISFHIDTTLFVYTLAGYSFLNVFSNSVFVVGTPFSLKIGGSQSKEVFNLGGSIL